MTKKRGFPVELASSFGALRLRDMNSALTVESLTSFGRRLDVHGTEFGAVPRGDRYQITGWRARALQDVTDPHRVTTARAIEEGWDTIASPALVMNLPEDIVVVTAMELPPGLSKDSLQLVLGGWESYSWSEMSVVAGGISVGTRTHRPGQWAEPLRCGIAPGGNEGVTTSAPVEVVLILKGGWWSNPRLRELDPNGILTRTKPVTWPAQFEQYIEVAPVDIAYEPKVLEIRGVDGADGTGAICELQISSRRVTLEYEWVWGGRALVRRGSVGEGDDLPVRFIDHGTWSSEAVTGPGGAGEPISIGNYAVRALLHPAGWSSSTGGTTGLRQFTSRGLLEKLHSAATIFTPPGEDANDSVRGFLDEFGRRRRSDPSVRNFFGVDGFGSWPYEPKPGRPYSDILDDQPSAEVYRSDIAQIARWSSKGVKVDYYSLDFLTGYAGEVGDPDPQRTPDGFAPLFREVEATGAHPGVWIDSASAGWSVGDNPKFARDFGHIEPFVPYRRNLCLGSDGYRKSFSEGLSRLAHQGMKAIKLDNFQAHCVVDHHNHLPGVHALEAAADTVIATLQGLERDAPDLLVHLYWGYRSPWWALSGTTLFDPGFHTEAAHPFVFPSTSLRSSTIHGINFATLARSDLPRSSKDSLGVWLSEWGWNSSQGKSDWQVAVAFDMVRANRFLQVWTGQTSLTDDELQWIVSLQSTYRENPETFDTDFLIGSLNSSEATPYALGCMSRDGATGLVGFHNPSWVDQELPLSENLANSFESGVGIIAGGGAEFTRNAVVLRPQAVCVVSFGRAAGSWPKYAPAAHLPSPGAEIFSQTVSAGVTDLRIEIPTVDLEPGQQAVIGIEFFRPNGERLVVKGLQHLARLNGCPADRYQHIADGALSSSWQVIVVNGPHALNDATVTLRSDLLGADHALVTMRVLDVR